MLPLFDRQTQETPGSITGVLITPSLSEGKKLPPIDRTCPVSDHTVEVGWFSVTFHVERLETLGMEISAVREMWAWFAGDAWSYDGRPFQGYKERWLSVFGAVLGFSEDRLDFHLSIPASALSSISWKEMPAFFREVQARNGKVTRLDLSIDDFSGNVSIPVVRQAIEEKNLVAKAQSWSPHAGFRNGKLCNEGVSIGSRASETYCRIYNKFLEQGLTKKEDSGVENWIRIELEYKGEKAQAVFAALCVFEACELGKAIRQIILGSIDFRDRSRKSNVSRCPRLTWFERFLEVTEPLMPLVVKAPKNIKKSLVWLGKSCAAALAAVFMSSPDDSDEIFQELLKYGFDLISEEESATSRKWNLLIKQFQQSRSLGEKLSLRQCLAEVL